jgi:hypothetical protein
MRQSVDDLLSQLRPITGPELVPAPSDDWRWVWSFVGTLVISLICVWFVLRRSRVTNVSPEVEALAAFDKLPPDPTTTGLMQLDHLARRYLSRVYFIPAEHMTSAELLSVLPENVSSEWSPIFAQLQPGRFSRRPINTEEWRALIQQVRPLFRIVHADIAGPVIQ